MQINSINFNLNIFNRWIWHFGVRNFKCWLLFMTFRIEIVGRRYEIPLGFEYWVICLPLVSELKLPLIFSASILKSPWLLKFLIQTPLGFKISILKLPLFFSNTFLSWVEYLTPLASNLITNFLHFLCNHPKLNPLGYL